ncbi:MAG: class I SAM-dependent DNA methyltransferase [Candidatus Hodarchaeota archaeon]
MLNSLVKEFDRAINDSLSIPGPILKGTGSWASLHGWNPLKKENQRWISRQAILNGIIRQLPGVEGKLFPTPLDSLEVNVPEKLFDRTLEKARESDSLNFWGELYAKLTPQPSRRQLGQFWTSYEIADWMVSWLLRSHPENLLDIGCGSGIFLLAASNKIPANVLDSKTELHGWDISPLLLNLTVANYLILDTCRHRIPLLSVQNFVDAKLPSNTDAVICNPPYTRHHHIDPSIKETFQKFFQKHLHVDVSRLATLAFYFLLKIIAEMADDVQAAFIVPMEVLDARYGKIARQILCQHTTISSIIHFSPEMNAFPNVDVGASIIFFRKGYASKNCVRHLTLTSLPSTTALLSCLSQEEPIEGKIPFGKLKLQFQDELVKLPKWFVIPDPNLRIWKKDGQVVLLRDLAKIVRGIATGANDFFVLTDKERQKRSLEPFMVRTIHRNREIQDILLDEEKWRMLSAEGKRVWLLYLKGSYLNQTGNLQKFVPAEEFKTFDQRSLRKLRHYIAEGEELGYNQRSLVKTRKQWYLMEQRDIPPIFYTLLTRGNPRFILNQAGVRPLNMFLLIYPNSKIIEADAVETLWVLLNSHFSLSRLHSVSRTYGGKTLKVEPGELSNLPVINPFYLSKRNKKKIKRCIEDFFHHRESSNFLTQINTIVKETLGKSHSH